MGHSIIKEAQYLMEPEEGNHGRLRYVDGYWIIEDAEPSVHELAKRVFPGCGGRRGAPLRFRDTRRAVGDLNWLLLRFPMQIIDADKFRVGREKAIAHAQRRNQNQNLDPVTPPASFDGELYPYQKEGVAYLVHNERCLLADDMGLGKTVTALAALAQTAGFPALIVVPTSVQRQWQRMAGNFLDIRGDDLFKDESGRAIAQIVEGLTPYELRSVPIYICHYGLLRAWYESFLDIGVQTVIFDEIQELRHTGTKKYSAASHISETARYVWGLSGTPIYNYGSEIWSITNILDYHCLGDYESFTREWCTGYLNKVVDKPEVLNNYLLREGLMLRRVKKEVQSQLPPKRRVVSVMDKDDKLYSKMISDAVKLARDYENISEWSDRGQAVRDMDRIGRLATGVSKAPYVADFVASLIEAGEKPLVYAWHHDVYDILLKKLKKYDPGRISGKETPNQKQDNIEKFQNGESNVLLISLRSAAGLDGLQERGTCVVFAELDWSPGIHAQCEDRLHRHGVGDVESILCYYLVTDTGHDEVMQEALGLKVGQFVGIMGDEPETNKDRRESELAAKRQMEKVIDKLKQAN